MRMCMPYFGIIKNKLAAADTCISVGDRFSSYDELKAKIDVYQKENFVQLAKRDSRTLNVARKRAPNLVAALVYYTIHFACVFGRKKYKNEGTEQRPQQKTLKQGCKAGIKVKLTEDGQSLLVFEVVEGHNHEVDKYNDEHIK